jgi:hypothetical protein
MLRFTYTYRGPGINRRPAILRFAIARGRMDLSLTHVPRGSPSSFVNNLTSDLLLQVHSRLSSRFASAPRRPSPGRGVVLKTVLRLRNLYSLCFLPYLSLHYFLIYCPLLLLCSRHVIFALELQTFVLHSQRQCIRKQEQ